MRAEDGRRRETMNERPALRFGVTTEEAHAIGKGLRMIRDCTAYDSAHRERVDGSFWTNEDLTRLEERFPRA